MPEYAGRGRSRLSRPEHWLSSFTQRSANPQRPGVSFGEFGVRGVGYSVRDLKRHLRVILGLDRGVRVAIVGAGNLGLALSDYPGFRQEGFEIVALFDIERVKVGRKSRGGVRIIDMAEFRKVVKRDSIDIVVLAVPAAAGKMW